MIYIGADKHGFEAINIVERYLNTENIRYRNLGVNKKGQDIRLEDLIPKVTEEVLKDKQNLGILSCGSGIGVEVGANKFSGIRACLANDPEISEWSRTYDNCNVLCLVGWRAKTNKINNILSAWLDAEYDGNKNRLKMLKTFDSWN